MIETYLTQHGWIVGSGVSEYLDMLQPICTLAECKAVWAKASPADRSGCLAFIKANSNKRMGVGGAWGFVRCTNLDTGRKFLAAALWLDNKGLSLNQLRGVVGLPKVKGGDTIAKGPAPTSLGKGKGTPRGFGELYGGPPRPAARVLGAKDSKTRAAVSKLLETAYKSESAKQLAARPKLMSREQAKRLGLLKPASVKLAKPKRRVR